MKNILLIMLLSSMTVGCASFQSSTYSNRNTPTGNVVTATGNAATEAAKSNRSYNCPSCTMTNTSQGGSSGGYQSSSQRNYIDDITGSASRTLASSISNSINSEIRDAFR